MGVSNGQAVDAPTTNGAFISKNQDDTTTSNLGLASTNPAYGGSITSMQREINALASQMGVATGAVYNAIITWAASYVGASTSSAVAKINALVALFSGSAGHSHTGVDGQGKKILATSLDSTGATIGQLPTANGTGGITWGSGGGGGGGSLEWIEDASNAPTPTPINGFRAYNFQSGLGQVLYAAITVPTSYQAGNPIKIKQPFLSADSSGTALLQTVATLIRPGTDAISSTTNQRTSTNTAITLGAGTVNIPQSVTYDLTDSAGKINGVSVGAGHMILVKLTRGSDTGASDLSAFVYCSEETFT